MKKRPHSSGIPDAQGATIPVDDLERAAQSWLFDGEYSQHSKNTLSNRRRLIKKLLWFLRQHNHLQCGLAELRQFLAYCTTGHLTEGGRWGNPHMTRPVRPRTVHTYHGHLRTLFRWLVAEGILTASPMERIAPPVARSDQIKPFTPEEIARLIEAARRSRNPKRNEAIAVLLYDTGIRASELCALRRRDMDFGSYRCTVLGKGNKTRTVSFSRSTLKALTHYLGEFPKEPDEPLFTSDRGQWAGDALTRSGLLQLIERLGKAAKIETTRCSPHTFRHSFAVQFLRNGGNVLTLKEMLGHTQLDMVNRYVLLAQADIENQHRQFSPMESLKRRSR